MQGYTPNAIVRFYNRLQRHCATMTDAIRIGDRTKFETRRSESLVEADVLKCDLKRIAESKR